MTMSDFQRAVVDLREIPKEVRKHLTPALKRAAEPVAVAARRRAGWSRRIPGAIRIAVRYGRKTAGVAVRVSAKKAPHARPFEHLGQAGTFRHPLFGDRDEWVTQAARPFLFTSAREGRREATTEINRVVEYAARLYGFR